jgi:hypothetical protein
MGLSRHPLMAVVLLGLLAGSVPATSRHESPPPADPPSSAGAPAVTMLPAILSVSRFADGKAEVPVLISNGGTAEATVSFVPLLADTSGETVEASVEWKGGGTAPTLTLRPGQQRRLILAIFPARDGGERESRFGSWWDWQLPLRGHIAVHAKSGETAAPVTTHEIAIPQVQPSGLEVLVLLGCFSLASLAIICWWPSGAVQTPTGPAALTADSLAATVGIGAGLANALLALTSLPTLTAFATRETYALLAAVFAALIALGAPASNLLGRLGRHPKTGFAMAAFLVLWGALGQMALGLVLVRELHDARALARSSQWLLWALIGAMIVGVLAYVRKVLASPEASTTTPGVALAAMRTSSKTGWSVP